MDKKELDDAIKNEFIMVILGWKTDFDTNDLKPWIKQFQDYGKIAYNAIRRYRVTSQSPFLEINEIMRLIRVEKAKELGIDDAETAWGVLIKKLGPYPTMPEFDPVMVKAINAVGGWSYLGKSRDGNRVADRSNFYRIYNKFYTEYLGEVLLNE